MQAPFSARFPFEVFHRVGDVNLAPIDACFLERPIEQFPGRAHKRFAGAVFLVARLLAHENNFRAGSAFAEDGLRPGFPQRTGAAFFGRDAQGFDIVGCRHWRNADVGVTVALRLAFRQHCRYSSGRLDG